ncbi:hypothetical protein H4R35_004237 [Dimargaris xerosporica]|nr:hypothetical protein H4R35_004237 [Dimargaris xerosporica]
MLMNEYQEYIAEGEKHRKKPFFRKTKSIDEGNGVAAMSSFLLHNASNHSFASTAMLPNGSIVHSGNGGFLAQSGGGAPSLHHSSSMVTAGSTTMAASTTTAAPTYVPDDMAFVYLDAKSYPFDMDYIQTFDTLCEVLCLVYNRIADTIATLSQTQALQDTIHKIDAKFKKIICLITKEIDELARQAIGDEFSALGYYSVAKSSGPNASFSMAWDPSEG